MLLFYIHNLKGSLSSMFIKRSQLNISKICVCARVCVLSYTITTGKFTCFTEGKTGQVNYFSFKLSCILSYGSPGLLVINYNSIAKIVLCKKKMRHSLMYI